MSTIDLYLQYMNINGKEGAELQETPLEFQNWVTPFHSYSLPSVNSTLKVKGE